MKILLFTLFLITLQATELDTLFNKLNNVDASQRYKIMNKIKTEIKQMNNSNRMRAINILNNKHSSLTNNSMHIDIANKMMQNKLLHNQMMNKLSVIEKKEMKSKMQNNKRNMK